MESCQAYFVVLNLHKYILFLANAANEAADASKFKEIYVPLYMQAWMKTVV